MLEPDDRRHSMDLRELGSVLRRRKWSVILVTLITIAASIYLVYRRIPVYSSTASVEVRPTTSDAALSGFYFDPGMDTEAARVTSAQVTRTAQDLLTEDGQDPALLGDASVGVSVPANTTYLTISCTSVDANTARLCADAYARAYVQDRFDSAQAEYSVAQRALNQEITEAEAEIDEIDAEIRSKPGPLVVANLQEDRASQEQVRDNARLKLLNLPSPAAEPALVSEQAALPLQPSNKDYIEIGVLALMLGLALGVGLAFLRHRLDDRVAEHLGLESALGAPVLAAVPHVTGFRSKKETIASISDPTGPSAEAYRSARTTLLYLAQANDLKVLLVTSGGPGEGKTTTAANLGVALARSDNRVIIVSADLRKPRLARLFGLETDAGLTDVIGGRLALRDAVVRTKVKNLLLLPSGPVPDEPAELLASNGMEHVVAQLREAADIVLIDSAPTLLVADSLELVPLADGVVVVADASSSTRSAVEQVRTQVERIGGTIVGCMLNNLDSSATAYSAYYGSRYGYRERGSKRRRRRQARHDDVVPTRPAVSVGGDADYFDLPPESANGNGHGAPAPASPGRRSPAT
jgi:capsular exopolysaccharide synthesis family protein